MHNSWLKIPRSHFLMQLYTNYTQKHVITAGADPQRASLGSKEPPFLDDKPRGSSLSAGLHLQWICRNPAPFCWNIIIQVHEVKVAAPAKTSELASNRHWSIKVGVNKRTPTFQILDPPLYLYYNDSLLGTDCVHHHMNTCKSSI